MTLWQYLSPFHALVHFEIQCSFEDLYSLDQIQPVA